MGYVQGTTSRKGSKGTCQWGAGASVLYVSSHHCFMMGVKTGDHKTSIWYSIGQVNQQDRIYLHYGALRSQHLLQNSWKSYTHLVSLPSFLPSNQS